MSRLWTDEERQLVYDIRDTDEELLYEDMARCLKEKGYIDRTAEAVRCMLRRERQSSVIEPTNELIAEERTAKILYFDIETTNLDANFGELLMMGYRWGHEKKYNIINIYDFEGWDELPIEQRDRYIVEYVADIIAEADVLVGHYSIKFDHRFIQTRCLVHKLPPIPDTTHIDTWAIAKYQLKLRSNRLAALAEVLGCNNQKAKLPQYIWRRSIAHDIDALRQLSKYCVQDVRTQYDVTQKLLPICKKMPNWTILTDTKKFRCPSCGSSNIVQRGYRYTAVHKYKRMHCNNCGKWMRGRTTEVPKDAERCVH